MRDEQDCISRIRCAGGVSLAFFTDDALPFRFFRDGSESSLQKRLNATAVAHVWRQLFSLTKSIDGAAVMHRRLLWKIYFEFCSLYELFLSTFHGTLRRSRARCPRELPRQVFSPHTQPFRKFDLLRCARDAGWDPLEFRAALSAERRRNRRASQPVASGVMLN